MSLTKYPGALDDNSNMPDRVPFVDLYEAAHMNLVQDAIKAIEAELGANPSGNLATLKDRLSGVIDEDGKLIPYFPGNVLTVGPDHCHYTSIQAAIDSITDASETKQYHILIYPNTYNENLTLKSFVHLVGFSRHSVIIAGKITAAPQVNISFLTIQKELQNDYLVDLTNSYNVQFDHVTIYNPSGNGGAVKQTTAASGNSFYHCIIKIDNSDENAYYPFYTSGKAFNLYDCQVYGDSVPAMYFAAGSYGLCDIQYSRFYGGYPLFKWEHNGSVHPAFLFCYFDTDYDVFHSEDDIAIRVANSVFNADPNTIYTNLTNTAMDPNNGNIMEE